MCCASIYICMHDKVHVPSLQLALVHAASLATHALLLLQAEIKRRQGVSQYRQPHVMLVKGLQELEALFPGYTSQLLAAGAVPVDVVGNWSLVRGLF